MNAADLTPLSPQSHADLMDTARARAVHLRQQAKAEFGKAIIKGATHPIRSIREFVAQNRVQVTYPSKPNI